MSLSKKILKAIDTLIDNNESYSKAYSIPWEIFYGKKLKIPSNISILLLNTTCNGFGDVVFCMKLATYIRKWYPSSKLLIASAKPEDFVKLGWNGDVIKLSTDKSSSCRRFSKLKLPSIPRVDLILVSPLQSDFNINREDVKNIIPYSDRFNTFFFSEYNDDLDKGHDFPTGIGEDRLGIFFTGEKVGSRILEGKYVVIYIADTSDARVCYKSFILMVSGIYKNFSIVLPKWILEEIVLDTKFVKKLSDYFDTIEYVLKEDTSPSDHLEEGILYGSGKGDTLTLRGDIFPLPRSDMLRLLKYSLPDVLLTGDQSITDGIEVGKKKNIFYQRVPWKYSFSKNLAKYLPNPYINNKETTCGDMTVVDYHSDYSQFKRDWDFRKLGKKKLDAIIYSISERKKRNKDLLRLEYLISTSKGLKSLERKMKLIS